MAEQLTDSLLEAALHAFVSQRCERAYIHEMRNSLQGIYTSVDVLTRIVNGKAPASMTADKVGQIARKAIQGHEQALTHIVKQLIVQREEAIAIDVDSALRRLIAFLTNDAAARDVIFRYQPCGVLHIQAQPTRFRLALLTAVVRAIDGMHGGELELTANCTEGKGVIHLALFPADSTRLHEDDWRFETAQPEDESWTLYALRELVHREGGAIASSVQTRADRRYRTVSVSYTAATPVSLEGSGSPARTGPPFEEEPSG